MSDFVTADQLLAECGAVRYAEREILGKRFLLKSINAGEYAEIGALSMDRSNPQKAANALLKMHSRLIYHVYAADQSGKRLFTMEQTKKLSELDSKLFSEMVAAAMDHTGFGEDSLEDAAKNSEPTTTEDSPTV